MIIILLEKCIENYEEMYCQGSGSEASIIDGVELLYIIHVNVLLIISI